MSIKHIAWIRFKNDVTEEQIESHLKACRGLVDSVPEIESYECGKNFTDRAGGFTHGMIVTVADMTAFEGYMQHPAHIAVASPLVDDLEEIQVMDFEC